MAKFPPVALACFLALAPFGAPAASKPASKPAAAKPDDLVRAQVLLNRAWFSAGEIDGRDGANMKRALRAFQEARGLPVTGRIDAATRDALGTDEPFVEYTITEKDVAGPFIAIPKGPMEKATLPHMGFENATEALAERFQVSPALLRKLNPGKEFKAGTVLRVPDAKGATPAKAASLVIRKKERVLQALDAQSRPIAHFPISLGTPRDELPVGKLKITSEVTNPSFDYDPALLHDTNPKHAKVTMKPGPNNPVGTLWLGLSKKHYGIHGTPRPEAVGHVQTNGCVHLTNWDAARLSSLVAVGTPVAVKD